MSNNYGHTEPGGNVYTVPFAGTALATTADLFSLTASTLSRVVVREIKIGQYSDAGDAEAEILQIRMLRGSTATTTGAAITPLNVLGHTGAATAVSSCRGPSTTLASTTSASLHYVEAVNMAAGWLYRPDIPERPVLAPGERMQIRMSGPADSLTVTGTMTIQEIGKTP